MVDRTARDRASLALRQLVLGRISNEDFEFSQPDSSDEAVRAIYDTAELIYSSDTEHKLKDERRLPPDVKREVVRWILFLDSSDDYVWPRIAMPGLDPMRRARRGGVWIRRLMWKFEVLSYGEAEAFLSAGDYDAWPFASRADFKRVLRAPRRLSGRRRV